MFICIFSRVQFTPDLLPSDILGNSIYNRQEAKLDRFAMQLELGYPDEEAEMQLLFRSSDQ
ncbi:MAG: AAA family ATPase [Victivallaceae bacterium]|nr:AAA family ATPase [Victivallaceae bacterium]